MGGGIRAWRRLARRLRKSPPPLLPLPLLLLPVARLLAVLVPLQLQLQLPRPHPRPLPLRRRRSGLCMRSLCSACQTAWRARYSG